MAAKVVLRRYREDDCEAAIELWRRAWEAAMPETDFGARLDWWKKRWIEELVPRHSIVVAEAGGLAGFVVIDPESGYLDQIVVRPESWGGEIAKALLDEAKRLAADGIALDVNQSNRRAVRFYEREGFLRAGESVNPLSGKPTFHYVWRPDRKMS
jgi:putative acetyltransferase